MAPYVRKKGRLFYFRFRVPISHQKRFGVTEVVRPIPARTVREAHRIARIWLGQCEGVCMSTRPNLPSFGIDDLASVQSWYAEQRGEAEKKRIASLDPTADASTFDMSSPSVFAAQRRGSAVALRRAAKTGDNRPIAEFLDIVSRSPDFEALDDKAKSYLQKVAHDALARVCDQSADLTDLTFPDAPPLPDIKFRDGPVLEPHEKTQLRRLKIGESVRHISPELAKKLEEFDKMSLAGPDVGDTTTAASPGNMPSEHSGPAPSLTGEPSSVDLSTQIETTDRLDPQMTLSRLWPIFNNDQIALGHWTARTVEQADSTLRLILEFAGDKPVACYTKADLAHVRRQVMKLPSNYAKSPRLIKLARDEGLMAVIRDFEAKPGKDGSSKALKPKTVNRHTTYAQAFFSWAATQGLIQESDIPTRGLHIKSRTSHVAAIGAGETARRPFEPHELAALFSCATFQKPVVTGHNFLASPSKFWGPIIACFSGMRRMEIAQLRVRHVVEIDGVWCFDLQSDPTLTLKNEQSRRLVPIHSRLLGLRIIESLVANRKPDDQLLSDLDLTIRDPGDRIGKAFGRLLKSCGLGDGLCFHSFRHTMITELARANVHQHQIEQLTGHSSLTARSTFGQYNAGMRVRQLAKIIEKFKVAVDIPVPPRPR